MGIEKMREMAAKAQAAKEAKAREEAERANSETESREEEQRRTGEALEGTARDLESLNKDIAEAEGLAESMADLPEEDRAEFDKELATIHTEADELSQGLESLSERKTKIDASESTPAIEAEEAMPSPDSTIEVELPDKEKATATRAESGVEEKLAGVVAEAAKEIREEGIEDEDIQRLEREIQQLDISEAEKAQIQTIVKKEQEQADFNSSALGQELLNIQLKEGGYQDKEALFRDFAGIKDKALMPRESWGGKIIPDNALSGGREYTSMGEKLVDTADNLKVVKGLLNAQRRFWNKRQQEGVPEVAIHKKIKELDGFETIIEGWERMSPQKADTLRKLENARGVLALVHRKEGDIFHAERSGKKVEDGVKTKLDQLKRELLDKTGIE